MKAFLAGALFVLLAGINVHAEGPCKADVEKFCKDVKPGGGRIIKCLRQHKTELSSACQAQFHAMKQKVAQAEAACKDDASRLCKDVKPGAGRIIRCLKSNEKDLTATCKATITPHAQ